MKHLVRAMFVFSFSASAIAVDFPKEILGNWGSKQGGCIVEINKSSLDEAGITSCNLKIVKAAAIGFTGTLACNSDGHPNSRSLQYDGKTLVIGGVVHNRCNPK